MTLTKTQIQNLLGVSRSWVNKRVRKHLPPNSVDPTHSELWSMVDNWLANRPKERESSQWRVAPGGILMWAWRPGYFVVISERDQPHILVKGVRYAVKTITSRFLDGWRIDDMASDYKCDRLQIEAAIAFELKARGT